MKEIAKCDPSDDENNDNSLTSEEDVVVGDSEDEWEPENESARIAAKPKRRASKRSKACSEKAMRKSKRAQRAMKQESIDEANDASAVSEEVVVVDSEEEDWATEGKDASKSAGPKDALELFMAEMIQTMKNEKCLVLFRADNAENFAQLEQKKTLDCVQHLRMMVECDCD